MNKIITDKINDNIIVSAPRGVLHISAHNKTTREEDFNVEYKLEYSFDGVDWLSITNDGSNVIGRFHNQIETTMPYDNFNYKITLKTINSNSELVVWYE